jgi:Rab GDP dissociation inhibitor
VYVACLSSVHQVCAPGFYVAIVSTVVETEDPHRELQSALDLLGPVLEKFVWIAKCYEPLDDGKGDGNNASHADNCPDNNVHITRSYDPSSHFESVVEDVKRVYRAATGQALDLRARTHRRPSPDDEQQSLERELQAARIV